MEEDFPRGGVDSQLKEKNVNDKNLFKNRDESKPKEKRKRKSKKEKDEEVTKPKKLKVTGEVSGLGSQLQPMFLSKKLLYPDMIFLGFIKSIQNYSMTVALPNGLSGQIPITGISHAYTDSLQKFAEAQDRGIETDVESVSTLSELFKVGMIVPCRLSEYEKESGSKKLTVSINPKDVNADLTLENIRDGMILYGNISSCEDHGYTLDIGVKGVQVFLKNEHAEHYIQMYNDGFKLRVGQCLMCEVKMKGDRMAVLTGQDRVINVAIDPKQLQKVKNVASDIAFASLMPGMKITAKIDKVLKMDGLVVTFMKFKGVVHKSHLPNHPDTYSRKEEVKCTILYIHPLTKTIYLSMLPHLVDYVGVPLKLFGSLTVGSTVESAVVIAVDKTKGVYLTLGEGIKGFAASSNLSDKPVDNILQEFRKGSCHRCRVMGFSQMEALVIVTLKPSILNQNLLGISDVSPGQYVECTIRKFLPKGLIVDICKRITGFIPNIHLADVTLHHPEQKFKVGEKLKCRVLLVNKMRARLMLTHKKSLLSSKYPIITDYQDIQVGQILEGFISSVKDFGCHVRFYNDVQGLVPRQFLSTEAIPYPEKVFFKGQIVRCKVVSVSPQKGKLKLTFILDGMKQFGKKEADLPDDYQVGQCVKCRIVRKSETGLDVVLIPSEKKAFIPMMHLSDSLEICQALWNMYNVGDMLENAIYWNKNKLILLTAKPCLLKAAKQGDFVTKFDDIQPGMMLAGAIKNIMSYGIFVDFAGGLFGLVPKQYAADVKVPDVSAVFHEGQTVVAKVMEVSKDKGRFLASLRMQDCYHGDTDIGLDITQNYLHDSQKILDSLKRCSGVRGQLANMCVGSVHTVTVKKVTKKKVICYLDNGVKAISALQSGEGVQMSPGVQAQCVILFVDLHNSCVEVSFSEELINDLKMRIEKTSMEKAKLGQMIKCRVLLIKEQFVLVKLKGHAKGQLAYLPSKRHWNDIFEVHQYDVGQENSIVIKRIDGSMILASLKVHEDKLAEDEDTLFHIPSHELKLGDICNAVVRKVYKDQIYIGIGRTHGRVHVTEMLDTIMNGTTPMTGFKVGDEVKVRVIGFREAKSWKYLPISHPNLHKSMPECSMKPSVLAMKKLPENYQCNNNNFHVGERVVAFATSFSSHCLWMHVSPLVHGKVYILNMSDDINKLSNPANLFDHGKGYNATVIEVLGETSVALSLCEKKAEVHLDQETRGLITCVRNDTGLVLQLADGIRGTVELTDMSDKFEDQPTALFKVGHVISVYVLEVDETAKRATLSLRTSRRCGFKGTPVDPEVKTLSDLSVGKTLRGYVIKCTKKGVNVRLGNNLWGHAEKTQSKFIVGNVVTVRVISITNRNSIELVIVEDNTTSSAVTDGSTVTQIAKDNNKKKKISKSRSKDANNDLLMSKKPALNITGRKKSALNIADDGKKPALNITEDQEKPTLDISEKYDLSSESMTHTLSKRKAIDSDDDSNNEEDEKKPKRSKEEIRKEKQEEENKLFEYEMQQLQGERQPETADDFDRLVLQSPDSSLVWLRYMAFHLQTTEIDKARAVAERALKTISFREEQEKMNVWVAYLNLESMYGTSESVQNVLTRAVQQNDQVSVYLQMINIYVKSGKFEDGEHLFNILVKKHSANKDVWIKFGEFYFQQNRLDSARRLFQRCLKCIHIKQHLEVIIKFAQMEFKHGEPERGKTMFENIVSTYPKRTDVWSVYLDLVTKSGDISTARSLYNRAISLKLPVKIIKFYFKKYLQFEEKFGTESEVAHVKKKALEYVESRGYVDDD